MLNRKTKGPARLNAELESHTVGLHDKFHDAVTVMDAFAGGDDPPDVEDFLDFDNMYPYQEAYIQAFEHYALTTHTQCRRPYHAAFGRAVESYFNEPLERLEDKEDIAMRAYELADGIDPALQWGDDDEAQFKYTSDRSDAVEPF